MIIVVELAIAIAMFPLMLNLLQPPTYLSNKMLVMQSTSKRFSQIFMTVFGLVLLAMALFLNHKHPHNEGIASLPRNSIYQLELSALAQAQQAFAAKTAAAVATPKQNTSVNAYSPPTTDVASASTIVVSANLCGSIDEQNFTSAQQAYDDSYKTYSSSAKSDDDYRTYTAAITNSYKDYQTTVAASGCSPTQPASIPTSN